MTTFFFWLTLVLFIFVSVFLILLVLIQKGRGGGLASAFGGAGGNTAFGSKTGDVLTWATSIVFAVFVFLGVCMNWVSNAKDAEMKGPQAAATSSATSSGGQSGNLPPGPPAPSGPPGTPGGAPIIPGQ